MVTNSKSEAEIIDVICNLYKSTEAEPDDVTIELVADVSSLISLAMNVGIKASKKLFEIIDVKCDIEHVIIAPSKAGRNEYLAAYGLMDSINHDTLEKFILDNGKEINDKFVPFLYVKAWCQDSSDFNNIVKDLNGIDLGSY